MSEEAPSETRSHRSWSWWVLWLLFIVFVVYPLSIGPVGLLVKNNVLPEGVSIVYLPLKLIYDNSDIARDFFNWYLQLRVGS